MRIVLILFVILTLCLIHIIISNHWKSIVKLHLKTYKKIKEQYPQATENELLNQLLLVRMAHISLMPPDRREREEKYYNFFISSPNQKNKKLADVVYAMIEFDYIIDRKWHPDPEEIIKFQMEIRDYINKEIQKNE